MSNACDALAYLSVTKRFSSGAGVQDVTLTVAHGDAYALLGPNGAGKTTLLNVALGFLNADRGSVRIEGLNVADTPILTNALLAYIPEIPATYPDLSALDNLKYFEALGGKRLGAEQALATLERLRFPMDAIQSPSGVYSKGMRQKVSLAAGLVKGASVFLLDEPFSGLDPASAEDFEIIVSELRQAGKAMFFTSHDIAAVLRTASRVGVLMRGSLAVSESVELFRQRDLRETLLS